jgi:predicted dinucleotide-binding enzyme
MTPLPTQTTATTLAGHEPETRRLGIIGAGKLGLALARAALTAGYDVAIAGSGSADRIALQVDVLAPGATAMTTDDVVAFADTVVLALPMHRFREVPADLFNGEVLIDAMNYWPDTDGTDPTLAEAPHGTSAAVQQHFPRARVVKTLNQLGYHELDEYSRPAHSSDRIAIAAAGDDELAVRTAMDLIDRLGFDAVDAGPLTNGRRLEPDGSPYATTYTVMELKRRLVSEVSTTSTAPNPPRQRQRQSPCTCTQTAEI